MEDLESGGAGDGAESVVGGGAAASAEAVAGSETDAGPWQTAGQKRKKACRNCSKEFSPKGRAVFCPECRVKTGNGTPKGSKPPPPPPATTRLSATKSASKRGRATRSPSPTTERSESARSKRARIGMEIEAFTSSTELATVDKWEPHLLVDRFRQCLALLQQQNEVLSEADELIEDLEEDLDRARSDLVETKLALADRFLAATRSGGRPSYADATRVEPSPVLVASIRPAKEDETPAGPITVAEVDRLLDAGGGGPMPQLVRQKGDKVFITFGDSAELERARAAFEKQPACTAVFKSVAKSVALYPAVVLFADTAKLDSFRKELELRDPLVRGQIHSMRPVYKKPGESVGHVRVCFRSREIRDGLISRGRVFAGDKSYRIVPVDIDREVRRCYKCQKYGHVANDCDGPVRCGKCAGGHRTPECSAVPPPPLRCANCTGAHQAGDKSCSEQKKAVARYRSASRI